MLTPSATPTRPAVAPDLSGHILYGAGPWGPGPVNVRGRGVDGRVWAAVATPSGAIADRAAPWIEVPPTWGPLADLLRIRAKSGLV